MAARRLRSSPQADLPFNHGSPHRDSQSLSCPRFVKNKYTTSLVRSPAFPHSVAHDLLVRMITTAKSVGERLHDARGVCDEPCSFFHRHALCVGPPRDRNVKATPQGGLHENLCLAASFRRNCTPASDNKPKVHWSKTICSTPFWRSNFCMLGSRKLVALSLEMPSATERQFSRLLSISLIREAMIC